MAKVMHCFRQIKLTSFPPALWQSHSHFQFLELEGTSEDAAIGHLAQERRALAGA